MNASLLEKQFKDMGARIKLEERLTSFDINILEDRKGEYFLLQLANPELDVGVVDLRPGDRHLLLLIREPQNNDIIKHKYLCGHDERHWFVAAVPSQGGVKDVPSAMEALKPPIVRQQQIQKKVKGRNLQRRKNKAYIRQGEWFFIPVPYLYPPDSAIFKNEPIRRGSGKPHMGEFLYRTGGEMVYVNSKFPNGLTQSQYDALCKRSPKFLKQNWTVMVRNAGVYVKGRVWHPDHATIILPTWHQVEMNREFQAPSMSHLAFLD